MGLSHSKEDDLDQDLPLDSQHLQREEQSGLELLRGTIGAALGAQEPPDPRDGPTLLCIQSRLPNGLVPGPTSQTTPARARPVSNVHHLHFGARSFVSHHSRFPDSSCATVKTGRCHQSYPSDLITDKLNSPAIDCNNDTCNLAASLLSSGHGQ